MGVPEDQPDAGDATTVDRTAAERLATAVERASVASALEHHEPETVREGEEAEADATDATEMVDKTDMSAVGDDGQVFGG